jgi:glycosyltransferase involved in cell wall biosynthesis
MNFDRAFNYKFVGSLLTGELFIGKLLSRLQFDFVRLIVTKFAGRKAKMIFALSEDIKKILLGFFPMASEKIHVIPLGADHNLFRFNQEARERVRISLGLSEKDLLIASPGKLIPEKNLDLLIKAVASLKPLDGSNKLLFVGHGSPAYIDSLKRLARTLNVEDKILFLPAVHRTKVPEYYSASDIAVFTASTISIIEAMSAGLPVIIGKSFVSKCELEYGNGFSYELRAGGGDLNALTAHLKKLISNPELRTQMGKRSRALVEDKLNWEKIAKNYLKLYKAALEK